MNGDLVLLWSRVVLGILGVVLLCVGVGVRFGWWLSMVVLGLLLIVESREG